MQGFNHLQGMKVGSKVVFGRPNGEKTKGEVVKINRKSVKVRQTEVRYGNGRTRQEGQIWNVHPSCLKLEGGETYTRPTQAPTRPTQTTSKTATKTTVEIVPLYTRGQKVKFKGKDGIVEGWVTRVNKKTLSVKVNLWDNNYYRVPYSLVVA